MKGWITTTVATMGWVILGGLATAVAAPADKPSPVTTTTVVMQAMREEVPLAGTAEALRESALSSRVAGVVQRVHVSEGDWVEAGQEILSLDAAIAGLEVASARARVDEAIARHEDAVRRKAEYQSLSKRNAVASTSLESAVADEQAARAAVSRERAELERFEELLSRHRLIAPFSGMVAEKDVEAGQWVKVDSQVLTLVALDRVRVRAALPQRYFRRIDTDSTVRVLFDALPGKTFTGMPSALVARGNQATRSFPLLIELDNAQHHIAPGMSARIFVELAGDRVESLLVPRDAIVLKADGSRIVWRVNEADGRYTVVPVSLLAGRSRDGLVEVLDSTLKPGDRIVLLGNENLRPGQAVQPRPTE